MLAMKVGQFPVETVLVEEKIAIEREFFLSFAIDDAARAPVIIFSAGGGSGIEERAASTERIPCDVKTRTTRFGRELRLPLRAGFPRSTRRNSRSRFGNYLRPRAAWKPDRSKSIPWC